MTRQVLSTHTSLSLGALKLFTLTSSLRASARDASTRKHSGMSRCSGRMNVRSAAMRRPRTSSSVRSSLTTANMFGYSFVVRYFSSPSPDASSSSSDAPLHAGCPRKAASVSRRKAWILRPSSSESRCAFAGI